MVRYAKEIRLSVILDNEQDEMIYVPYLFINYKERATSNILDDKQPTEARKGPLTTVSFETEYASETPGFTTLAITFFWITFSLMVLMWII